MRSLLLGLVIVSFSCPLPHFLPLNGHPYGRSKLVVWVGMALRILSKLGVSVLLATVCLPCCSPCVPHRNIQCLCNVSSLLHHQAKHSRTVGIATFCPLRQKVFLVAVEHSLLLVVVLLSVVVILFLLVLS